MPSENKRDPNRVKIKDMTREQRNAYSEYAIDQILNNLFNSSAPVDWLLGDDMFDENIKYKNVSEER